MALPSLPHPLRKETKQNSHLLTLLAKLRTGTTGRAATARLATEETARRANMLAGGRVEFVERVYAVVLAVDKLART